MNYLLLLVIFLISNILYLPIVLSNYYNLFSQVLLILFLLLFFRVVKLPIVKVRFFRRYVIFFIFIIIFTLTTYALGLRISLLEIKDIIIPLMIMVIGYCINLSEKKIRNVILFSSLSLLAVVYVNIIVSNGGFIISDQYLVTAKNSIGVSLGIVSVVLSSFVNNSNKTKKYIFITLILISLFFILTIRARGAFIATMVVLFLLYSRNINILKYRKQIVGIGALLFLCSFLFPGLYDYLYNYFYQSFFLNKTDDFSSGRVSIALSTLSVLNNSPMFGRLVYNVDMYWVHNYILLKLSDFGLLGGLPWFFLFCFFARFIFKAFLSLRRVNIYTIGVFALIIPFLVSLGEPSFPYGPGTANILAYFLFGVYLSYRDKYIGSNLY